MISNFVAAGCRHGQSGWHGVDRSRSATKEYCKRPDHEFFEGSPLTNGERLFETHQQHNLCDARAGSKASASRETQTR